MFAEATSVEASTLLEVFKATVRHSRPKSVAPKQSIIDYQKAVMLEWQKPVMPAKAGIQMEG